MSLRRTGVLQPLYEEGSGNITIIFHVGGTFVHVPAASYEGGTSIIFDNVNTGNLSLFYLDELNFSRGIIGYKKYYKKEGNGFVLLHRDRALQRYCEEHAAANIVHLYVDQVLTSFFDSQAGSSNVQKQPENDVLGGYSSDEDYDGNDSAYSSDDSAYSSDEDPCDNIEDGDHTLRIGAGIENMEGNVGAGGNDLDIRGCLDKNDTMTENNDCVRENGSDSSRDEADSEYDMDSLKGSDEEENAGNYHMFNAIRDMKDPHLYCGLNFANFEEFKKAVRNYNINKGRAVTFYKSDKERCRAKCKAPDCKWEIYAKLMHNGSVQVRVFNSEHKCNFNYRNPTVTSTWVANKYLDDFKLDPNPNMKVFRKKYLVYISHLQSGALDPNPTWVANKYLKQGETSSINESQRVRRSPRGFSNAEDTSSITINEPQPLRRSPRGISMARNISSMNMNVSQSVCTSSRVLFRSIEHPISAEAGQKVKRSKELKKLPCKRSSDK